ncbi:MAG: ATP-dependent DNA helicase, partial [Candidatus Competibacteraceae bacterium]|nr:ATP-dependent DNA helicase [Candidatus Competibacteraceae bacterium]
RKALAAPVRTALLKGRANYLCRHRLDLARAGGVVKNRNLINQLLRIQDWSGRTRSGDVSEVTDVPEDSSVWPRVTSTAENCLGQNCPQLNECFVLKARRQAMEADILVINHHLFCADMVIKDEGFGEILPGADAFIIDEAHHLLEVASQFFGQSISTYQLTDLAHDISIEQQRDAADFVVLTEHAEG